MQDRSWVERVKDHLTERVIPEVGAEMKRLGVQGQMELANAMWNGSAFVPYGPGQYTPSGNEQGVHGPQENPQQQTQGDPELPQQQQERGGRSL